MQTPIPIADVTVWQISRDQLKAYFGDKMHILGSDDFTDDIFDVQLPPGHADFSALYKEPGNPLWENLTKLARAPQDHPGWHKARAAPLLFTASRGYKYALQHHGKTGRRLELTPAMILTAPPPPGGGVDPEWEVFFNKRVNRFFPPYPDDVLSHTFMVWGTTHENNALATFMEEFGDTFDCYEQGLTFVTPDILARAELRNLVTGEIITSLPFLLAASPDTVLVYKKGPRKGERVTGEWKSATGYLPGAGIFGVTFNFRFTAKPYEKPKGYYYLQKLKQMLACETRETQFGCWTYMNGMNVWEVPYNKRHVEIYVTLLLHLFARGEPPPIGYFYDTGPAGCKDQQIRALARELEDGTLAFMELPITHHIMAEVGQRVTKRILGQNLGDAQHVMPRQIVFPDVYPQMGALLIIGVYSRYFCAAQTIVKAPSDLQTRDDALLLLTGMSLEQFVLGEHAGMGSMWNHVPGASEARPLLYARSVIDMIKKHGLRQHDDFNEHPAVKMWRMDRAERYVLSLIGPLYRIHRVAYANHMPLTARWGFQMEYITRLFHLMMARLHQEVERARLASTPLLLKFDDDETPPSAIKRSLVTLVTHTRTSEPPRRPHPDREFGLWEMRWHVTNAPSSGIGCQFGLTLATRRILELTKLMQAGEWEAMVEQVEDVMLREFVPKYAVKEEHPF
jgi:hypothetical protein